MDDLQARLRALDAADDTAETFAGVIEARHIFAKELDRAWRCGALVPASALAEAQAKIEWFRVDNDKMLAGFVQAKLEAKEAQAEISRLRGIIEVDLLRRYRTGLGDAS